MIREDTNRETSSSKRKVPYKTTLRRTKIAGILCLVILVAVLILMSPIFKVKNIKVEGLIKLTSEDVVNTAGLEKGDNIFTVNETKLCEKIMTMGRVTGAKIIRSLPSTIVIEVDERSECAYIKEKATYTGIDENGLILLTASALEEKVPVIYGIQAVDSVKGQYVKIDSDNAGELADLVVRILTELKNQGILTNVKSVDISNLKNIRMTLSTDTLVNFGEDGDEDGNNIEYKIAYLKAILAELSESQNGGVIELADTENVTSRMS